MGTTIRRGARGIHVPDPTALAKLGEEAPAPEELDSETDDAEPETFCVMDGVDATKMIGPDGEALERFNAKMEDGTIISAEVPKIRAVSPRKKRKDGRDIKGRGSFLYTKRTESILKPKLDPLKLLEEDDEEFLQESAFGVSNETSRVPLSLPAQPSGDSAGRGALRSAFSQGFSTQAPRPSLDTPSTGKKASSKSTEQKDSFDDEYEDVALDFSGKTGTKAPVIPDTSNDAALAMALYQQDMEEERCANEADDLALAQAFQMEEYGRYDHKERNMNIYKSTREKILSKKKDLRLGDDDDAWKTWKEEDTADFKTAFDWIGIITRFIQNDKNEQSANFVEAVDYFRSKSGMALVDMFSGAGVRTRNLTDLSNNNVFLDQFDVQKDSEIPSYWQISRTKDPPPDPFSGLGLKPEWISYGDKYLHLIKLEILEEEKQIEERIRRVPLSVLCRRGLALQGVTAMKEGAFFGDPIVIFHVISGFAEKDEFRQGNLIIASRKNPITDHKHDTFEATVLDKTNATLKVVLRDRREIPEDLEVGTWRVDAGCNRVTYDRMKEAVNAHWAASTSAA